MTAPDPGVDPGDTPQRQVAAAPVVPRTTAPCTVHCKGPCGQIVWQGGTITADGQITGCPEDGQVVLTEYANAKCRLTDCPNTTAAVEAQKAQQPAAMAAKLKSQDKEIADLKKLVQQLAKSKG